MKSRHRVFIGINLPSDIKKFLAGYQKKWPELPARWVTEDNLHITLVFLGYLTDIEIGETCMAVKEVSERYSSFNLNLKEIIYGPSGKLPPRMVWANGENSKELSLIKKDLEEALSERVYPVKYCKAVISQDAKLFNRVNFKPEKRGFNPHITLARIKTFEWRVIEPEERPEINEIIDLSFDVGSIEVMESVLRRTGPTYSIIESHTLSRQV